MFKFTKDQEELSNMIIDWYTHQQSEDFVYSGPAGTGKTTVLWYIIQQLGLEMDEVIVVAYTGKAASVLMQKGFDASTIHSAFFDIREMPLIINNEPVIRHGRYVTAPRFIPKEFISSRVKLIIVDEWSMVNKELMDIIYKHNVPVIASGDSYQLEPIFGQSPFAKKVKYELKTITRQGQDSGIIQLATQIRLGQDLPYYYNYNNNAWVMPKNMLENRHLLEADIVLTAKNKTRELFNNRIRDLHGSKGKLPKPGDKLINRKNNWSLSLDGIPLINGILGKVVNPIRLDECDLAHGIYRIDYQPDYITNPYEYYEALPCDYDYLQQPCGKKEVDIYNKGVKMEYGEAITVHSSQGSQFGNVIFWDEWMGDREMMQKLRYTAVTRATDKVYMFV